VTFLHQPANLRNVVFNVQFNSGLFMPMKTSMYVLSGRSFLVLGVSPYAKTVNLREIIEVDSY